MKAVLYAVKRDFGWEARVSVAWEVDRLYWEDPGFRRHAVTGRQTGQREGTTGCRTFSEDGSRYALVRLSHPLPLGIAVMACDRWQTQAGKAGDGDPLRRLVAAVEWAAGKAGESEAGLLERMDIVEAREQSDATIWQDRLERSKWESQLGAVEGSGQLESVRRGEGNEAAATWTGALCGESVLLASPSGDSFLPDLPRYAREVADRLHGYGLLLSEAMAALGDDGTTLLPALQLASLLGDVRFAAAVGPVQRRAGFGWLRGGAAEMCCRRCGSAGDALHRTPCAACGRQSCAYCEVCLTMGRSRECGLLVIGAPATTASADRSQSSHLQTPTVSDIGRTTAPLCSSSSGQTLDKETEAMQPTPQISARWGLSPAQQEAAETALAFLLKHRKETASLKQLSAGDNAAGWRRFWQLAAPVSRAAGSEFLLWAVTGAGKTEMMFPLLDAVLSAGGKVAVATPRRDVVLELAPRLAAAFPDVRQVVLYGGSEDRFQLGDLTLATTHQLIRFKEAFDLVVIDEVDAFPFHNDPALYYAAAEARASSGMTLLLSATPPAAMQRRARRGRLPHARVAVRHHRHPLPVPQRLAIPPLFRWAAIGSTEVPLGASSSKQTSTAQGAAAKPAQATAVSNSRGRLPAKLREAIRTSIRRGAQLFIFVPFIRQVEPLVRLLRQYAPTFGIDQAAIDGTSSHDPQRGEKVTAFRGRPIRLLVTTTILERGVTVPKSDVFVLDADKPLFDAASLVQMAGRAGRSADDPYGRVIFAASAWTNSQRGACKQICEMNAYARRKGFLLDARMR